jgi:glutamine synthetase
MGTCPIGAQTNQSVAYQKSSIETPYQKALKNVRTHDIPFIDITWSDILGNLKEISIPTERLEAAFENGLFFDGSSIKGFTQIFESDLRLDIDPESISFSAWQSEGFASARFFCDLLDSEGVPHKNDPRSKLRAAIERAYNMGYECLCGAEIEFFLFKQENGRLFPFDQAGYCDAQEDAHMKAFQETLLYALNYQGINPEKIHHEVAPGQLEVVLRYTDPLTLADRIQLTRHTIKMLARQHGFFATFVPKPLNNENGSGMHIHASLKQNDVNAFYDATKECNLSDIARSFISGVLKHVPEINILFNAVPNSNERLVKGFEAPVYLCCGDKNRSAAIRIPETTNSAGTRIELRWPDSECNPYLALTALFETGLNGIEQNMEPVSFVNKNLYHVSAEEIEAAEIKALPESFEQALELFKNSDFAKKLLGTSLHESYYTLKEKELNRYQNNKQ